MAVYVVCYLPLRSVISLRSLGFGLTAILGFSFVFFVLGVNPFEFIVNRFGDVKGDEAINPLSSGGFRIYETIKVLSNLTWFGHGMKAPLFLYRPWERREGDWYGIHSQYIEILHTLFVRHL